MATVSIVIKAFNEETGIARTIESCLAALEDLDGEVIVADCLSNDRTIEVASQYPITIVQLTNPGDRGCGAGAQLGYQHSSGEYIYLIDADMVLHRGFLKKALTTLGENTTVAGVGGILREMNFVNEEFQLRALRRQPHLASGLVDRLNGGGLYRRAAIESVGYFADRNLHSYEEFDLGLRLRAKHWSLVRLGEPAVDHYSYLSGGYELLLLRASTGYARGLGELLRISIGQPYIREALRLRALPPSILAGLWLLFLLSIPLTLSTAAAVPVFAVVAAAPFATMSLRRKSFRLGLYSVVRWISNFIGMVQAFLSPRVDPHTPLESRVLRQSTPAMVSSFKVSRMPLKMRSKTSPLVHTAS